MAFDSTPLRSGTLAGTRQSGGPKWTGKLGRNKRLDAVATKPHSPTFRKGQMQDDRDAVGKIQVGLGLLGFSVGAKGADGYFGADTERAVVLFQGRAFAGLPGVDTLTKMDGVVGNETIHALDNMLAAKGF